MKKFLSFILVFVLCFVLVGCGVGNSGGGNTDDVEIPAELTKEPIEVEFWHAMGKDNVALIARIIDNFEREYAAKGYNINVVQQSLGDYTALRDAVTSNIAAGTQPTIAQTYPDHVALYIAGQAMQELDSYADHEVWGFAEGEREQYIDGFYAEGKIYDGAGTLYSLPFNKSTEVLYYNKTMFENEGWDVPRTWDEVVEIAEAFAETTEYADLKKAGKDVAGFSYDSESNLFITFTQQWGGEYTGYENTTGNGTKVGTGYLLFDNAKSKEAIKFYYDQFQKGNMVTTSFFGTNYSSDAFKAGQCIMTLGSSAGAKYNNPEDESFEVGVAAYPQKDINNPQVIQQGTNVSLFKCADPQEELAGWLFLKYLTNYESAMIWVTGTPAYTNIDGAEVPGTVGTSYFPIRKDVLNSDQYKEYISGKQVAGDGSVEYKPSLQNLAAQVGLQQQDWFFTNVAFDGSSAARDRVGALVKGLLTEDHGDKNIDDVIDEAYEYAIDRVIYG